MELLSWVTDSRRIWILLLRILWMLVSRDGSHRHWHCSFVIVMPTLTCRSLRSYQHLEILKQVNIRDFWLKHIGVITCFGGLTSCGCWYVSYLINIPAKSVAFEEEGTTFLRKIWSHRSKDRSLYFIRPESSEIVIAVCCVMFLDIYYCFKF
jgi:hypothetical protein